MNLQEFLGFKEFEIKKAYTPAEKALLANLLNEFLKWGGFPEIVLTESIDTKQYLLKGYLDTMLLRDVIEKNNIQNTLLMDRLLTSLIGSFTKNISVNKWYNDFKSMGLKVSKDTLYSYLGYLKETGFIHIINEYGKPAGSGQKVYLIDNGLYEVRRKSSTDSGKLLENSAFTKILREGTSISYWNKGKSEIDFITAKELIQVCYSLNEKDIKREISGFESFIHPQEDSYPSTGRQPEKITRHNGKRQC